MEEIKKRLRQILKDPMVMEALQQLVAIVLARLLGPFKEK